MRIFCDGTRDIDISACVECPQKKCSRGQYFSSTCTCSPCSKQPIDCTNTGSATPLFYVGCDGSGTIDNAVCKSSNFECGPECIEGESFENVTCMPTQDTVRRCRQCSSKLQASTLGVTRYVAVPCNLFTDSDLRPCTPRKSCPKGWVWSNCTKDRDGMCMPCTSSLCNATQFLSPCLSEQGTDSVCTNCNTRLRCTAPGTYRASCSQSSDHVCMNCTRCQLGTTYEYLPCTNVSNRVCRECTHLAACPPDHFKRSSCTLTRDTDCQPCSSLRFPCPFGYFESAPCTAVSDRICTRCTAECSAGKYMASECTATRDATCLPCSSPICTTGNYKTQCSGASDAVCAPCTYPTPDSCPDGYFQNVPCTPVTNGQCKQHGVCRSTTYQLTAGNKVNNTVCEYCTNSLPCLDNQYETKKCTALEPGGYECGRCTPRCEFWRYVHPLLHCHCIEIFVRKS